MNWQCLFVRVLALCIGIASQVRPAIAVEPWADPRLKVTEGMHVWLDAAALPAARKAASEPPLKEGDAIARWADASGKQRDLAQQTERLQPTYQASNNFSCLRFNGKDQSLSHLQKGASAEKITVFLVTAPFTNPGMFSGPLGLSAKDGNDFQTGLNLDQGPFPSQRWEVLNVEGAGATGAQNLLSQKIAFGEVACICVVSQPGKQGIATWVNGQAQGKRDRAEKSEVRLEQLVVGARYYNFGPPEVRGFFEGEIAELIIYDRALADAEREKVEAYLATKYGSVPRRDLPYRIEGKPLVSVEDPPPVQMFVPGFSVKQLPVDLTNVNNILYRADGQLVALGYDGHIRLLRDTNNDGLEDHADLFWENKGQLRAPIGMALTPPGYKLGQGVFVAAKGKCLLLADTNNDNQADREIVVAEGWQELPHGVDALGVAVDPKDHSIYLGIGTKNFTDPYDRAGSKDARYPLQSERGTVLRIAPDFRSRSIFATGIRFPVSLRFDPSGALFCSDQEGATWLPNGNPFDELLHVERGRHYGFPPRHPKHLPDVIDEPSVFDYAPQHQSTCGMNFNTPVSEDDDTFGPAWWRADLFMTGYSRGKLYRTKLVKSPVGYVAQNQLLACLNMLACDACVSPQGDLVVAVHSGGPDWGSGPSGKGKLYKITHRDKQLPQPSLVWAQSPQEVRVAFDRPLELDQLKGLQQHASIEYGPFVAAGDRFESLRPGYQVVQDQLRAPRHDLPIHSLQLSADRRTLILATASHPQAATYALTMRGLGRGEKTGPDELPQHATTDLQYQPNGLAAVWHDADGKPVWHGWLPHLDLAVARELTTNSAEHDALWPLLETPGELKLRTSLRLQSMLRPAVQPGAKIDYEWPRERVTLTLVSNHNLIAKVAGKVLQSAPHGEHRQKLQIETEALERLDLELAIATGKETFLESSWHTQEDPRPRALPLQRFSLPWVRDSSASDAPLTASPPPELAGGNWARGKQLFFGEQASCAKCHTFRGAGAKIGPDLSNLPQRDYASVLRDITQPSYAINPDYITQSVELEDGRILTGTLRTEGDILRIADTQGLVKEVQRQNVGQIHPSSQSIMPEGLLQKLGPAATRDLLTFLLTKPPAMPDYGPQRPPPPRSLKEVDAILAGAPQDEKPKKLNIALVTGRKDHGPGEHDYPAWQTVWSQLLSMSEHAEVSTAADWPSAEQLKTADVLAFYQQGTWNAERAKDLDAFLKRGGGAIYIHYAVDGGGDAPGFAERIGLAWKGGHSKFRHGPLDLAFAPGKDHPIARNFDKLHLHDESYWQLLGDPRGISLLATGREDDSDQPLFWTVEHGKGRVFVSIPGHFSWSFDDPLFRVLLLRGIAWAGRAPVDQFNDLVLPGARVE